MHFILTHVSPTILLPLHMCRQCNLLGELEGLPFPSYLWLGDRVASTPGNGAVLFAGGGTVPLCHGIPSYAVICYLFPTVASLFVSVQG